MAVFSGTLPSEPNGSGIKDDPYLITDVNDLATVWTRPRACYRMEADIDLSGIAWNCALVPGFSGLFDGNDHVISNLNINGGGYLGLFGICTSGSTISNVGLEVIDVNGTSDVVGGLVGQNRGDIMSSYSTGSINGTGDSVGGLIASNSGSITSSYSTGAVSGIWSDDSIGGFVGVNSGTVWYGFWDTQSSGLQFSSGGVGLTTTEMMDPEMLGLNGLSEDPNWVVDSGKDYPHLAWEGTPGQTVSTPEIDWLTGQGAVDDPYCIESEEQLIRLSKAGALMDRSFKLVSDLSFLGLVWPQAVIPYFQGIFDGQGHVIYDLTIEGYDYLGFFGRTDSNSVIVSLGLEFVYINGDDLVGGLVGYNEGGAIRMSYSTGTVRGDYKVGGLVGYNEGTITSSYSSGALCGHRDYVGGLVGCNECGTVTLSNSNGTVYGGGDYVGGLVGWNDGGTITKCYCNGIVSGELEVGGLVGYNQSGTIMSSYSSGVVNGDGCCVGGLVGTNGGTILTSYSTGVVVTGYYYRTRSVSEKPDLASSGPFSACLHPAVSTIYSTSPASPSLSDEKMSRSRAGR